MSKATRPPLIDERIEFRGTSFLRSLNTDNLEKLQKTIVFQDGPSVKRLAVLIPYDQYVVLQQQAVACGIAEGLDDIENGREFGPYDSAGEAIPAFRKRSRAKRSKA